MALACPYSEEPKHGWKTVKFGDIAENVATRVEPAEAETDVYVGLEHLDPRSLHLRTWGHPSDVTGQKLAFKKGDVIFGRRRAYQRKLAVAEFDGICSAHAMVLRAKPEMILPELLPFFLQSDTFMERAVEISVGSLSPTINWKTLRVQEFPLPPIEEQKRIAKVLWAADEVAQTIKRTISGTEQVLKSIVNEFAHDYAQTHKLAYVNDVIEGGRPVTYGILKPGLHVADGIPVVKVKDFPNGVVNLDNLLLTSPEIESSYKRSRLKSGDLLISIRGTVGRLAEVPSSLEGANITQDTARLSINPAVNKTYVRALLESVFVQKQIQVRVTGLAVQGINLGELRKLPIPLPPRDMQEQIAERYEAASASLQAQDAHLRSAERMQHTLREAMFSNGTHRV